MLQGSALTQRR